MVAWVAAADARRSAPIVGRLGRYMSIASGPSAVSEPSSTTMPQGVGPTTWGARSTFDVIRLFRHRLAQHCRAQSLAAAQAGATARLSAASPCLRT